MLEERSNIIYDVHRKYVHRKYVHRKCIEIYHSIILSKMSILFVNPCSGPAYSVIIIHNQNNNF